MDATSLVEAGITESRLDFGWRFIRQLIQDGFPVPVAFWAKTSEAGVWFLYIASPVVDERGLAEAYRSAYSSLSKFGDGEVSISNLKLVAPQNPVALDAVTARGQSPDARTPFRYNGQRLGNITIDVAYIYPAVLPQRGALEILARGREAVLGELEHEAAGRTGGKTGEYVLARDDRGRLLAVIAGHMFLGGGGTVSIGDNQFTLQDGLVLEVLPSK